MEPFIQVIGDSYSQYILNHSRECFDELRDAVYWFYRTAAESKITGDVFCRLFCQYSFLESACTVLGIPSGTQQDTRNSMFLEGRPTPS